MIKLNIWSGPGIFTRATCPAFLQILLTSIFLAEFFDFLFLARAALMSYQTDQELENHYKDETSILKPFFEQITSGLVIHLRFIMTSL